jgi:uncharacterized protein (TIGR03083 family)
MDHLAALHLSSDRLRRIVEPVDDATLSAPAYPTEWTIAQVLSHLGSAAVIHRRRLDDSLAGRNFPDGFPPAVWDEWNAKSPRAQADDGLAADAALLARLDAVTADEQDGLRLSIGPLDVDFAEFVGLRLNEHTVHTWDVEVAIDPAATIPVTLAAFVVDSLGLIVRYTARAAEDQVVVVRTEEPERTFALRLSPDGSSLEPAPADRPPDLELPAEAFVRLLYGRLDRNHTPAGAGDEPLLATLRQAFPGP